jgi:ABC-2 type transport system permease protein
MPIHDQSYRRYAGQRDDVKAAWLVIARTGIVNLLKKRAFVGLLAASWIQFVVQAVRMYLASSIPQAQIFALSAESYRGFLDTQSSFLFFVTIYVGAGLIADDRRANALQLYLSKPLTRIDYIGGKMAILMVFLLGVTMVPALLLLLLQGVISGSFVFLRNNLRLIPAITLFSLVQVLTAAFSILALSSMSNSSRFVGIMYAGVVFFTAAMYGALRAILGTSSVSWISFSASVEQVGDAIFRTKLSYDTPPIVSFIVVLALMAVSVSVLERKVRGVEIVT